MKISNTLWILETENLPNTKMELSHTLTLNEEALSKIPEVKKPIFIYEWLRYLDKVWVLVLYLKSYDFNFDFFVQVLMAAHKSDVKQCQKKLVEQLMAQLQVSRVIMMIIMMMIRMIRMLL